jgi:NAD(P)-dependent dehydrogenase (short-subunit alcohol dehydrogenase family)
VSARVCAGRVALVTGASRGIGKAIAVRLAAEGAAVAICSRPSPGIAQLGTLEQARDEIAALGGPVIAIPFDVGDRSLDRAGLVDQVEQALGPVDILVNNAASNGYRPFLEWTDDQIANVLELNFWSCWNLVRRVLPTMIERGEGWILNVSSQAACVPPGPPFPPTQPARFGTIYGGTKAFMDRWTASLAVEMFEHGIAANTIAPQAAAATEALVEYASIPDYLYEPLETMAEGALALCTADPATLTGQVTTSLQLLADLERPVYDLHGAALLDGWQPETLPTRIEKMRRHAAGEVTSGPTGVDRVVNADGALPPQPSGGLR